MTAPAQTDSSEITGESQPRARFRIVDEGPAWLVVDKPPFLLVHPSKPGQSRTLWDELRALLAYEITCGGQVSIINRLDRETSGLTLIAKDHATARDFSMQMEQRRIAKEYLAVVWGSPPADHWEIEAPILRQGDQMPSRIYLKQMVHPLGAYARTSFSVEERFTRGAAADPFAVVRARPETGRMHQIRVHLAHSGFPVVGDKIYGPDEKCYLEFIETGWNSALRDRLLLPRHALHSASLQLSERGLRWSSELPEDLRAFVGHTPIA